MTWNVLKDKPSSWPAILLVLALFVGYGYWQYNDAPGDDLASSYVGSRMLSEGLSSHLFSYDKVSFAEIGNDDTWTDVAKEGHFYGFLHPYVQTPLWAYVLQPLCRRVYFPTFNRLFNVLTMLSFAGCLWLTARYWAYSFFNPIAMTLAVVALALSQPFQYAMFLNQTHMLMVFLTLLALVLAEEDHPWAAGLLLACAAAVKITPALMIVYWLLTGRRKAAVSALVWSVVLGLGTVLAVGPALTSTYLANLHRISRVLLLAKNNQSFAAWIMQHFYSPDEIFDINILPLPTAVRLASSALMLAFTIWGGLIDRRGRERDDGSAPLGAMMAMVAATVFAPIAWTHYAILLLIPLMILVDRTRRGPWWMWLWLAVIAVLNYRPIASDVVEDLIGPYAILRGQFFACMLTLAALPVAAWQRRIHRSSVEEEPFAQPDRAIAA